MNADADEIVAAVRAHLSTLGAGVTISTNELMEAIYPHTSIYLFGCSTPDPDLQKTRRKIYTMLGQLAKKELKDCCRKGKPTGKKFMGRLIVPWLWHRPPERECCLFCGQELPLT